MSYYDLLNSQMRFFVDLLRHFSRPGIMFPPGFMIYHDGTTPFLLPQHADELKVRMILADIYKKGFWDLWNSRYDTFG